MSSDLFLGTSEPWNRYVPSVGLSNADKQFKRVVFPEPEGPKSMTLSPSEISRLMPSRAFTTPAGVE
jgi:hypothetical protein